MNRLRMLSIAAAALAWAAPAAAASACIASGDETAINAALNATGSAAVLCKNSTFLLKAPVVFTAPQQQLYTQGRPRTAGRAILRVTGANQTAAILANQSGADIESIEVDGNRPGLGLLAGSALIEMGGTVSGQVVKNVRSHDPRGWSAMHIAEGSITNGVPGCQGATIKGNQIGPSGMPDGHWADGISLACGTSVVSNNTITDATDGAIVIFGAPGSQITNNVIIANTRVLLGGINLVDYMPTGGNYSGVVVKNNTIDAAGAMIKVGIAMGPAVWGCDARIVSGATVADNTLTGAHMGYGYPVNGVGTWKVKGNVDNARHVGLPNAGCGGPPSAPAGFQMQGGANPQATLQPQYVDAAVHYVLSVAEPAALAALEAPAACAVMNSNQGLIPGASEPSCDGRFALTLQADGNLALRFGATQLWTTGTGGKAIAQAIMQADGDFVLDDYSGAAAWSTGTGGHPGARIVVQSDGNLVIYDGSQPIWSSATCCH